METPNDEITLKELLLKAKEWYAYLLIQWKTIVLAGIVGALLGLGYSFLFLLAFRSQKVQIIALITILIGYWLAFALYPLPDANFNYADAGITKDWEYNLSGFAAHWNKNTNAAWAFDQWFLNLFPREKPFVRNGGGYSTLSFIPTLGTMILGLLAGNILKSDTLPYEKLKKFIIFGVSGVIIGLIMNRLGIST